MYKKMQSGDQMERLSNKSYLNRLIEKIQNGNHAKNLTNEVYIYDITVMELGIGS